MRLERTLIAIDNQQAVKYAVEQNFESFKEHGVKEFMAQVLMCLTQTNQKNLGDSESIQAAIIYELLSKCHEK